MPKKKIKMIVPLLSILFFIASILCYLFENNLKRCQICVPWKLINNFEDFCYTNKIKNKNRSIDDIVDWVDSNSYKPDIWTDIKEEYNMCCEIPFEMIIVTLLKDHEKEFGFTREVKIFPKS